MTTNDDYYNAVDKMEKAGVDTDYVIGWQAGFLGHPEREEQRVSDAYSAGYEDGSNHNTENFSSWVKS